MKDYLQNVAWVFLFVAGALAAGFALEWFRRRALRNWAKEQGGTFEPGSLLGSVEIPEAAAFDGESKPSYSHVSRIPTPEATYVLAQYYLGYKDVRNNQKSMSYVVCFITRPGADWPSVDVEVTGEGSPEALARLLPPAAREELLANETLIAGLKTRGGVARLQAVVPLAGGYPHREIYAAARRLVAAWK
ncbi:MAG TPA: hypothetical protein VF950_12615 [Planctomycetota bacterium]